MSMQNYGTVASRNLIRAAQGMLEHAQPITVLGDFGTQREMPQNSTDTLEFRRTLPFGASTTGTSNGISRRVTRCVTTMNGWMMCVPLEQASEAFATRDASICRNAENKNACPTKYPPASITNGNAYCRSAGISAGMAGTSAPLAAATELLG